MVMKNTILMGSRLQKGLEMGSKCRRPPTFSFRTTADLQQEIRIIFPFFPEFPIECFKSPLHNCAPTCRGCAIPHSMGTVALSVRHSPVFEMHLSDLAIRLSGYHAISLSGYQANRLIG